MSRQKLSSGQVDWIDLRFVVMSRFDKDRRMFRIDREASTKLVPTWSLTWIHQPSKARNSKQHWLRYQRGIRSKAEAMGLAEQWQAGE